MNATLQTLMGGLIDYAGLFPPAGLNMGSAVDNYARYRESYQSSWLGRFVVPVARLPEFEQGLSQLPSGKEGIATWPISALVGLDLTLDLEKVASFNLRYSTPTQNRMYAIDALEIKATEAEGIREAMKIMPTHLIPYFEIPLGEKMGGLIQALSTHGGRAKIRTGGITPEFFPAPESIAEFVLSCTQAHVAFKATAGLHHPLRSVNKLTYEPQSQEAMMHGFLNIFLAAAFAYQGIPREVLVELIQETNPKNFLFHIGGVSWRNHKVTLASLREVRKDLAIAFGSCSFEEPFQDLTTLGLL